MPCGNNILLIENHRINGFLYRLGFDPVVFYDLHIRYYLDFRRFPLIFDMNMNRFMVIRIKEKAYSKYK